MDRHPSAPTPNSGSRVGPCLRRGVYCICAYYQTTENMLSWQLGQYSTWYRKGLQALGSESQGVLWSFVEFAASKIYTVQGTSTFAKHHPLTRVPLQQRILASQTCIILYTEYLRLTGPPNWRRIRFSAPAQHGQTLFRSELGHSFDLDIGDRRGYH